MKKQQYIIYGAIAISVIVISIGLLITPHFWKNSALMTDEQVADAEKVSHYEEYSDVLKIYSKTDDVMTAVDDLQENIKKINQKANLQTYQGYGFIVVGYSKTTEYIRFDIVHEEEDSPDMAINFVYHEEREGTDYTIRQSGEKTYQHFNGVITSEFESKDEAILDHLLYQD